MIREVLDWYGGSHVTKRSVLGWNDQPCPHQGRFLSTDCLIPKHRPRDFPNTTDSIPSHHTINKSDCFVTDDLDAKVKRIGAQRAQAHMVDQLQEEVLKNGGRAVLKGEFGSTLRRSGCAPFTFGQVFRIGDGRLVSIVPGKQRHPGASTDNAVQSFGRGFLRPGAKSGSRIVVERTFGEDATSGGAGTAALRWCSMGTAAKAPWQNVPHLNSATSGEFGQRRPPSEKHRAVRQRPEFARFLAARLTEAS